MAATFQPTVSTDTIPGSGLTVVTGANGEGASLNLALAVAETKREEAGHVRPASILKLDMTTATPLNAAELEELSAKTGSGDITMAFLCDKSTQKTKETKAFQNLEACIKNLNVQAQFDVAIHKMSEEEILSLLSGKRIHNLLGSKKDIAIVPNANRVSMVATATKLTFYAVAPSEDALNQSNSLFVVNIAKKCHQAVALISATEAEQKCTENGSVIVFMKSSDVSATCKRVLAEHALVLVNEHMTLPVREFVATTFKPFIESCEAEENKTTSDGKTSVSSSSKETKELAEHWKAFPDLGAPGTTLGATQFIRCGLNGEITATTITRRYPKLENLKYLEAVRAGMAKLLRQALVPAQVLFHLLDRLKSEMEGSGKSTITILGIGQEPKNKLEIAGTNMPEEDSAAVGSGAPMAVNDVINIQHIFCACEASAQMIGSDHQRLQNLEHLHTEEGIYELLVYAKECVSTIIKKSDEVANDSASDPKDRKAKVRGKLQEKAKQIHNAKKAALIAAANNASPHKNRRNSYREEWEEGEESTEWTPNAKRFRGRGTDRGGGRGGDGRGGRARGRGNGYDGGHPKIRKTEDLPHSQRNAFAKIAKCVGCPKSGNATAGGPDGHLATECTANTGYGPMTKNVNDSIKALMEEAE